MLLKFLPQKLDVLLTKLKVHLPRKCTFTLGAVWGALEEITGKRLKGTHTESVLRGGSNDVFEFA